MLPAPDEHTLHGELEVRRAALLGFEALGYHAVLLERVHFEEAVPAVLTCCWRRASRWIIAIEGQLG